MNGQIGPARRNIRPAQRRQELFVYPVRPPDIVAERKQPDVIDHRVATDPVRAGITRTAHDRYRPLRGLSGIGSSPVYDFLVAVDCILTTRLRLLCIDEIAIVPEPDAFA
jgi:hypothetical protein